MTFHSAHQIADPLVAWNTLRSDLRDMLSQPRADQLFDLPIIETVESCEKIPVPSIARFPD